MTHSTDSRLARGTYVGGHDACAIIGAHPFMSPLDVWAKMTGRDRRDIGDSPPVRRGRIVEPGLLGEIERIYDAPMTRDVFRVDGEHPFFGGTLDGIVGRRLIEATSTTSRSLDSWGEDGDPDGPAVYKWLQVQWYLGLRGLDAEIDDAEIWLFIVDTGELRRYPVDRVPETIARLRETAEAFYRRHVVEDVPPDVDLSTMRPDEAKRAVEWLSAGAKGEGTITREIAERARAYRAARDRVVEAESAKSAARYALIAALGSHERVRGDDDGERITVSHAQVKGTPSTDWRAVARELARRLSLSDAALGDIARTYTDTRDGFRRLVVSIKPMNNSTTPTTKGLVAAKCNEYFRPLAAGSLRESERVGEGRRESEIGDYSQQQES